MTPSESCMHILSDKLDYVDTLRDEFLVVLGVMKWLRTINHLVNAKFRMFSGNLSKSL